MDAGYRLRPSCVTQNHSLNWFDVAVTNAFCLSATGSAVCEFESQLSFSLQTLTLLLLLTCSANTLVTHFAIVYMYATALFIV